jgi:hydrogenase maturation protease
MDLRQQLCECLKGHVCLVGLGNVDCGDDGLGVRLAERLGALGRPFKSDVFRSSRGDEAHFRGRRQGAGDRRQGANGGGQRTAGADSTPSPILLQRTDFAEVFIAGSAPERIIGQLADRGFDHLLFLDAVEFGGSPGSVVLLNAKEMSSRFPQVSTHRLSLGLLAHLVEARGSTRAWLLGVQPGSLGPGGGLSSSVQATVDLLAELVGELTGGQGTEGSPAPVCEEHRGWKEAAC